MIEEMLDDIARECDELKEKASELQKEQERQNRIKVEYSKF